MNKIIAIAAIGLLVVLLVPVFMSLQKSESPRSSSTEPLAGDTTEEMNRVNEENMANTKTATFGAGCFWGVESVFQQLDGVTATSVGYMGGKVQNPSYRQVCTDLTGHAEVVRVEYDPEKISYDRLLEVFFELHDPTQVNRQGPDVGTQYRSAVFYYDDDQMKTAEASKAKLAASGQYKKEIATEIVPAAEFWMAEEYHQDYYKKKGIAPACVIKNH